MAPKAEAESFGPEAFAGAANVSRETLARLELYAGMLEDWNARSNLVSRGSLRHMWHRHFWDSAQLVPLIPPKAKSLVDLGSGAGFPGLVVAELMRGRPGFRTVLYEATGKKCRFLGRVAERLDLPIEVRHQRIEDAKPEIFAIVTARACAPLAPLLSYAQRFLGPDSITLLLKGQNVGAELTQAGKSWRMQSVSHRSQSDPAGVILEIRELRRVAAERNPSRP